MAGAGWPRVPRESSVAQQVVRRATAVRPSGVVSVPVARLRFGSSFREGGVNGDHVRRLVRLGGRWSPILVDRVSGVVIDGVHRVAAARVLGLSQIEASLFTGDPDEALIEFVRRNVHHGLPLTLRERKSAAGRVLSVHPEWSDRRIAEICALSPKTVGRMRGAEDCPSEEVPRLDCAVRVGRDDRVRPVNSGSVRARVVAAIEQQPGASLRSVAASVGVSPETVRSVRLSLTQDSAAESAPGPGPDARPVECQVVDCQLEEDRVVDEPVVDEPVVAAPSVAAAEAFGVWFARTGVGAAECARWMGAVPAGRLAEIVGEARRRAQQWLDFANAVERRVIG